MKILKLPPLRVFLFLAPLLLAAPAIAQDDLSTPDAISLRNQILQLQAQVNSLQAAQNGQGGPTLPAPVPQSAPVAAAPAVNNDLIAALVTRVSNLEDQVRTLTGEVDELTNQLKVQNQSFTKQIGDINFQLQGGAQATPNAATPDATAPNTTAPDANNPNAPAPNAPQSNAAPTSLTPGANGLLTGTLGTLPAGQAPATAAPAAAQPATTQPEAAPAAPSSADILQQGITNLARKDYKGAESAAKQVLGTDRATPLGYDAQFLLARAFAGKRAWQDAVVAYDDTYSRSHWGSHSQDAQLGEAKALMALSDDGAACGALKRLVKQYPTPRADLAPAIRAAQTKACH